MHNEGITLHEMFLAYRKVKSDLWWAKTVPSLGLLNAYEKNLSHNLEALRTRITSYTFAPDAEFLGTTLLLPKTIKSSSSGAETGQIHFSSLSDASKKKSRSQLKEAALETRLMALPSIDFQILGALWVMNEGATHDQYRSVSCRANVLRRKFSQAAVGEFSETESSMRGPVNKLYPGLFKPYFNAYKGWRSDGLNKTHEAVRSGKRAYAITLDLKRYYHQVDANCLRLMYPPQDVVTNSFYKTIEAWQKKYGEEIELENGSVVRVGIPVGLLASALIGNLALDPLDKAINAHLKPIYYGRYVDDLFIVVELEGEFSNGDDVIVKLSNLMSHERNLGPKILWKKQDSNSQEGSKILFEYPEAWGNSKFESQASKQRIFELEGKTGIDFLSVVDRELKENSSELRFPPDLEDDDDEKWLKEMLVPNESAAVNVTSLRKADSLSVRRMGVAVSLRKLESIQRLNLAPGEWRNNRIPFYEVALNHLLSEEGICDFWANFPRLFSLLFSVGDWDYANKFLTKILSAIKNYATISQDGTSSESPVLTEWLSISIKDEFAKSCTTLPNTRAALKFVARIGKYLKINIDDLGEVIHDFRNVELGKESFVDELRRGSLTSTEIASYIQNTSELLQFFENESDYLPLHLFKQCFSIRRLNETDICMIDPEAALDTDKMRQHLYVVRGQSRHNIYSIKPFTFGEKSPQYIHLVEEFKNKKIRIAVSNLITGDDSWKKRVMGTPDLNKLRLTRILGLVKRFLIDHKENAWADRPLYFCFPELSIPKEWLVVINSYFASARVSLIVGGEYEKSNIKDGLVNPAYLFLETKIWVILPYMSSGS